MLLFLPSRLRALFFGLWIGALAITAVVVIIQDKVARKMRVPVQHVARRREVRESPQRGPYLARRQKLQTRLLERGPAPQEWEEVPSRRSIEAVRYPSAGRQLKAWVGLPLANPGKKAAAVVYLHGGFSFSRPDMDVCLPLRQAGYLVMCPTFRGENGNPGDFELCYGEVDDARAAVRWLAKQPGVDAKRIYVLGDDNGGVIASLMSLYGDGPERFTASCSGIRRADDYTHIRLKAPYDRRNAEEGALRSLIGHAGQMRKEHVAFYGDRDRPCLEGVRRLMPEIRRGGDKLTLIKVEGDSRNLAPYGPALFLKEIDAFERRNASRPKAPRSGIVS